MKRHKFNEIRFYIVFFTIYIVLNNLIGLRLFQEKSKDEIMSGTSATKNLVEENEAQLPNYLRARDLR
jgi:hypothetical protein